MKWSKAKDKETKRWKSKDVETKRRTETSICIECTQFTHTTNIKTQKKIWANSLQLNKFLTEIYWDESPSKAESKNIKEINGVRAAAAAAFFYFSCRLLFSLCVRCSLMVYNIFNSMVHHIVCFAHSSVAVKYICGRRFILSVLFCPL